MILVNPLRFISDGQAVSVSVFVVGPAPPFATRLLTKSAC